MKLFRLSLWLLGVMCCCGTALAQGTAEDYRRAYSLREKYSANKVYYSNVVPSWIDGTHSFWYVRRTPEGRIYVLVNADKSSRKDLFDHKRLAEALSTSSGQKVESTALSLERLSVNSGLDTLRFTFAGHKWMYAVRKNRLTDHGAVPAPGKQRHWMEVDLSLIHI